jgi:hypothetical protein
LESTPGVAPREAMTPPTHQPNPLGDVGAETVPEWEGGSYVPAVPMSRATGASHTPVDCLLHLLICLKSK